MTIKKIKDIPKCLRLRTINKILRPLGLVLVVTDNIHDGRGATGFHFESASRWPLVGR